VVLGYSEQNALPDLMQLLVVLIYGLSGHKGVEGEWIIDEGAIDGCSHLFAELFVVSDVRRVFHGLFGINIKS
jgi:hypothetical protein